MSTSSPLVSVVIPFYNGRAFLEEAIASVFEQTVDDWELLLVDDGSTDDATDLAQSFAERHADRVRYLQHPGGANRGASASRNLGACTAVGEFVAFLDADDVWLADKLEQQVAAMREHPEAGWTYGRGIWWYSWAGAAAEQPDSPFELGFTPDSTVDAAQLLSMFLERQETVPSSFAIMARRELLDRTGGGSEESFRSIYDDQVAFAKLVLEAPVYVQAGDQYLYRQHPNSRVSVSAGAGEHLHIRLPFLEWLRDLADRYELDDPAFRGALDAEIDLTHLELGVAFGTLNGLNRRLPDRPDDERYWWRLQTALSQGAFAADMPAGAYAEHVLRNLPAIRDGASKRIRGWIESEFAVRERNAGNSRAATRHAWKALCADPSTVRHHAAKWILIERVIGGRVTRRLRNWRRGKHEPIVT